MQVLSTRFSYKEFQVKKYLSMKNLYTNIINYLKSQLLFRVKAMEHDSLCCVQIVFSAVMHDYFY